MGARRKLDAKSTEHSKPWGACFDLLILKNASPHLQPFFSFSFLVVCSSLTPLEASFCLPSMTTGQPSLLVPPSPSSMPPSISPDLEDAFNAGVEAALLLASSFSNDPTLYFASGYPVAAPVSPPISVYSAQYPSYPVSLLPQQTQISPETVLAGTVSG